MKKLLAIALAVVIVLGMAACNRSDADPTNQTTGNPTSTSATVPETTIPETSAPPFDPSAKSEGTMTYAEYAAAALDTPVVIECFVQAHQDWWDNKITVYAQDPDGAYFLYEMACSQEDAAKLVPGTKIKVTGTKGEWAGEVEVMDATFEIMEGSWIAEPTDVTALLGTEDLIKHQNKLASFNGMTIEKIEYKNGEPGDDIYVTVGKDGASYDFCVEIYLTGEDSDVYKTVGTLKVGDVVDVEGFLYWYNGLNTHVTNITLVVSPNAKSEGVMSYAEYAEADLDTSVVIEAFVQAHQSWWDNKITVYTQDYDGGYFLYEMACSEEDAAKLVPGTKIRVSGVKAEWSGEVEIVDATFEIVPGDTWIAEPMDATALLGTDDLIKHQNKLATFKGVTIEKIEYKNGEPGDDIYVTVSKDGAYYDFCVEIYLTGVETDVYKAFATLKAGDVVDIEGFIYWYNGVNTHITAVAPVK